MSSQHRPSVTYITVNPEYGGQRLDNFLLRELKGVPRSLIYRIVRRGEVRVNEHRTKAHARLRGGDRIRVPPLRRPDKSEPTGAAGPRVDVPTLFEDDDLLIIDKPAGMAVHAGSGIRWGMIEVLRCQNPQYRFLELVHRLDRDTSGCLMLAKKRGALRILHQDLRQHSARRLRFRKVYQALVWGDWTARDQVVDIPLRKNTLRSGERLVVPCADGSFARTRFSAVRRFHSSTLMEAELVTGRTHQVRVHAAASGHPILGDEKYGHERAADLARSVGLKRLFLHASTLEFIHPGTSKRLRVFSSLPGPLVAVLDRLGGD